MTTRMMDDSSTATTTGTSVLAINSATTTTSTATTSGSYNKGNAHNSDRHLGKEATSWLSMRPSIVSWQMILPAMEESHGS